MTEQEQKYFSALTKDRADSADILEKPSMRGIKNSVVEKYSDQAHFIYELLQNADDAHATSARFILRHDQLIFAHNGTRLFSVSDPSTEDEDSIRGALGDINAITSIANSNKTEASIGKFGVGFKAVFQYTSTPHIYDPNFRFKIERFIVPRQLPEDSADRRPDETLFVFPFDHPERNASEAYEDISDKLKNLSYPLLFLSGLKNIEFEFGDVIGLYEKSINKTYRFDDVTAEFICLTQNNKKDDLYDENLWLFSKLDENNRRYSVGFFTDEKGNLRAINEPAFCFFPTKEVTGLNFIIHAPFLLTDSREGIRAGVKYNNDMIQSLADLAARAIKMLKEIGEHESHRLIDDSIIDIIPYDPENFSGPEDKRKVSFLPFHETIKKVFQDEEILPSLTGYVSSENAYWADVPQLPQLFSNEQLSLICDDEDACWAFPSIGRDATQRSNKSLASFIDSITRTNINEDAIISGRKEGYFYNRILMERQFVEGVKGINAAFIEHQSFEWLHKFYKWLSETKHRQEAILKVPIFINQDGKAVAAFDTDDQPILFLPVDNITGYSVVNQALLEDKNTREFIRTVGIKKPALRDQIYNIILPQYESNDDLDTEPHFKLFFEYYCSHCMNGEDEEFIDLIKDYDFINYFDSSDNKEYRGAASTMYMPTQELKAYFETKPGVRFVAIKEYEDLVGLSKKKQLMSFLTDLGIKTEIEIKTVVINYYDSDRTDLPSPYSTRGKTYTEKIIDGCKEIVNYISEHKDKEKSVLLWNVLLSIIENKCTFYRSLSGLLEGECRYFYYSTQYESFPSSDEISLKEKAWIVNKDGEFLNAENLTKDSLYLDYDVDSDAAHALLDFLNIADEVQSSDEENEDDSYLTDSQKEKIEFADRIREMGIEESDLEELKLIKEQRVARQRSQSSGIEEKTEDKNQDSYDPESLDDLFEDDEPDSVSSATTDNSKTSSSSKKKQKLNKNVSRVVRDIAGRTKQNPSDDFAEDTNMSDEDLDIDQDDFMPSPVDYEKRIERAKQKSAAEIDKIAYFDDLQQRALTMPKYSFGWFKTLLEMESLNSGEANANSKEISISFGKVEREKGTKRTLVLKHPTRYIPQFMEDLADIPLILHMGDTKKTVAIEVANVKSYTLRVKLKNADAIDGIDLSTVNSATIDAKSPVFLLEALRKEFSKFEYADDYNMQENLTENIEFIFGPPGTGKTTYLSQNVLLPLMRDNEKCKVLVLTPTNKAADVLIRRIMEVSGEVNDYENWLIRFGATGDEEIEQSPVFRDKTFDIRTLSKSVTVTTIARFPYDFFMPQGTRLFLNGINWDYIVIDEASMIPLVNIIYPLYKKTPRKFIIAGDPFQIEPITSIDLWKNENIFTLVHLDSFVTPKMVPYQYEVKLLTTQYRSIPEIGRIFSDFAYGGILNHYRTSKSQKPLNIDDGENIKALNIIKFPVSKYESIYRAKRLQHSSSYQIYSALFTYEYICYLSRKIAASNPGGLFKIGVIAPYRAQADLIDKLMISEKLPDEVEVQVGTIHGFQGDECDIIFSIFNTPPTISASKEMFLNKRNIINVSISRARDYLFIIMPDDNTENISNLQLVKRVERLIKQSDSWTEQLSPDIEQLMFGDSNYLENNTFSTSHQSVNVYGLPEKCYEVRTEDSAVDVQIHRLASATSNDHTEAEEKRVETKTVTASGHYNYEFIPKELRNKAVLVNVSGVQAGEYYLIPYKGELKKYTDKKLVAMFIPQFRSGKERLVGVSVDIDNKLIYITKDAFKAYEKSLTSKEELILKKSIF